jgi:5-methylcytosine-specific restriction endonuclease McrA
MKIYPILRNKKQLEDLYQSCGSMKETAHKIGCGETAVHRWIHRHAITPKPRIMTMRGHKKSDGCRKKLSEWAKTRIGNKNPNWKNGATPLNILVRGRKWRERRKLVLERDNYECQECGCDLNLHIHHIKSVSKFPELVNELSNLITLCKTCHYNLHFHKENLANSVEPRTGNAEPSTELSLQSLLAIREFWKNDNLGACVETINEKPIRL